MKRRNISTVFGRLAAHGCDGFSATQAQGKPSKPEPHETESRRRCSRLQTAVLRWQRTKDVTLSQYRGKSNVVLAFYIFAFTGG